MRKNLSSVALLGMIAFVVSAESHAQLPRGTVKGKRLETPYNTQLLQQYLSTAGFYHLVTVDSGGAGDFVDLGEALAWVGMQSPSLGSQWTVLVYPGSVDPAGYSYTESSLLIPNFTAVAGLIGAAPSSLLPLGRPMVKITSVSGAGVTLGTGSSIIDVGFNFSGVLTPGYKGLVAGSASSLTRVVVAFGTGVPSTDVQADIVSVASGQSLDMVDCAIQRIGNGMTATRHLTASGGSAVVLRPYFLASSSQAAVVEATGGTVRLLGGRIFGGAAVDVKNSSGTLTVDLTAYATESGAITRAHPMSPRITSGGSSLPANCSVPEIYLDSNGGSQRICGCVAANTWKCSPLS